MESIHAEIVASAPAYRISRVEVRREPLLGAVVTAGSHRQFRFVESGGLLAGTPDRLRVMGRGHAIEISPDTPFLYLPIASHEPLVEWVLAVAPDASPEEVPRVKSVTPLAEPIALPVAKRRDVGRYPAWAAAWFGLPSDVATWASARDVRGTSLTQRAKRLVGETPKRILAAARATVAFELLAHARGEGATLAADVGYASQAHFSSDLRARFGVSPTRLVSSEADRALSWIRLVKSVVR